MTPEVRRELNERLTAGKLLRDAERITAGLDLDKVTVTVGDARRIGACEYGIRSWCHRVGIDYETGQATLRAVVEGYREYPLPEVRATLIAVCEKQRHVSA
jgi:hypothetical protein